MPCPIPWLNSDLGNKKGVCRPGTSCPLEVGGCGLGIWRRLSQLGRDRATQCCHLILERWKACLSACGEVVLLHQPHLSSTSSDEVLKM